MADEQELAKREMEEKTEADEPESDSDGDESESESDDDESESDSDGDESESEDDDTESEAELDPAEAARREKMFAHTMSELRNIPEDFLLELFCNAAKVMGAMQASGLDYKEILRQSNMEHPSETGESSMKTALNTYGYPLRPGEQECSYYLKAGRCKFGAICRFNHPQPAGVQVATPRPNQQHGLSFPALSGISPMSGSFADLPREVLLDILVRLPGKSIGVSRCVSKPWLSLLTNYEFTKAHLAHHTHLAQEQKLLLRSSSDSLFSLTLNQSHVSHFSELEFNDEQVIDLVGSCKGLVLVSTGGRVMWLVNFMIEEVVKVPASPFPLCRHLAFKKFGFGYDEVSDDYKIVKISQCDYGQSDNEPNCPEIFVDLFSLKMRSWKRLETPFYGHDLLHHDVCVFINGAFHWIGLKNKYSDEESIVIGAFDLSDEKLKEIPAPASLSDVGNFMSAKLMVLDGCLGIVVRPYAAQKTEIWLMKSYSVVESWTKLVVDFSPICFHVDRILFKGERDGALKWYCVKDGSVEACLVVNDGSVRFTQGIAYTESLVSPIFNHHD